MSEASCATRPRKPTPAAPQQPIAAPLSDADRACLQAPAARGGNLQDVFCSADADPEIYALWAATHRCLRHIYLEDNSDDAVACALIEKLATPSRFFPAGEGLRKTLETARLRTQKLKFLGPTLRALQIAWLEARFDHAHQNWVGIDGLACERAQALFDALPNALASENKAFIALVEPYGYASLETLLRECERPHE